MFSIGDTVFYGAHGICSIEDIQEQKFGGEAQSYYILRSHHSTSLTLYYPVNAVNSKLKKLMTKEKAQAVLQCFENAADSWNDRTTTRHQSYQSIIKTAGHLEIAQMTNTLLRKKLELEAIDKKLPAQDTQILQNVTAILYEELATTLQTTASDISDKVDEIIQMN
ncbi:CarD family transcriptional regulator [Lysinibacillus sp. KU-BSD001]|uniref:CarD family transcriptional regulator n=1 Tax=Lysinibacillus sp. KU-BSD001 TaxID=3141328 RepID=UPI0036DFEA4B